MIDNYKTTIIFIILLGILSVVFSFMLSFVLGVFFLDFTFVAPSWVGAILYYPYVSIVVLLALLKLLRKKNQWVNTISLLLAAVLCGGSYVIFSIWLNEKYLHWMYLLQPFTRGDAHTFMEYSPLSLFIVITGVLLSVAVVIFGMKTLKKN